MNESDETKFCDIMISNKPKKNSDFKAITEVVNGNLNFLSSLNIKTSIFIFLIYIGLNSDIFMENTLSMMFSGVYDSNTDSITRKGLVLNGCLLSILYMLIDFMNQNKII